MRYFLLLVLLLCFHPVLAQRVVTTQTPYYYNPNQAYWGGSYNPYYRNRHSKRSMFSDINELEKYSMNKTYARDTDRSRLERLEMQAFGAVQHGDMYTRYNKARNALLSRPQQNYKTSLVRTIGNYFTGQLTGYTPSITDDIYPQTQFPYEPNYGRSYSTNYSSPWGSGFSNKDYGVSSSSGVRILD